MGRKSDRDRGFFTFGIGVTYSFQGEGKVEVLRKRLNRSRMIGKVIGRLSVTRRRLILSGPVELTEQLRRALCRIAGVVCKVKGCRVGHWRKEVGGRGEASGG